MISTQIIKRTMENLHEITKIDFAVYDMEGGCMSATWEQSAQLREVVKIFALSEAESQEVKSHHFFKVTEALTPEYILIAKGSGEDVHVMGKVACSQLQSLITAYKDRYDKNTFFQNLLLDNLLVVDIHNRAKKLRIETEVRRMVFLIEIKTENDTTAMEILKGLFSGTGRDYITEIDEKCLILIKDMGEDGGYEEADSIARMICDMMDTEGLPGVRVAYGTVAPEILQVSRSYKEAHMALEVGKIFYTEKRIHAYNTLGIGRLIYQLPVNLCEMFMNEVFTKEKPDEFDEETVTTINKFFENNLNVSETARQMFVHRNTLVYRLEKLERLTGLDIRSFEDALTFKIALMVTNYMRYMSEEKGV